MTKKRKRAKEAGFGERLVTGIGAGCTAAALMLAVFALLIKKDILDIDAREWIVIAVNALSAFICGLVVTPRGKGNIIKCGTASGIIYALIISFAALLAEAKAFSMSASLKILLISAAGSTIGSIVKLCKSNKKYHRQH